MVLELLQQILIELQSLNKTIKQTNCKHSMYSMADGSGTGAGGVAFMNYNPPTRKAVCNYCECEIMV